MYTNLFCPIHSHVVPNLQALSVHKDALSLLLGKRIFASNGLVFETSYRLYRGIKRKLSERLFFSYCIDNNIIFSHGFDK